jgi:hypothetical protein
MVLYVGGSQLSGGISHAQIWNMNTAFEGEATPIASNWSQTWNNDIGDANSIGSNSVTESSGIFTFGATGIWDVRFTMQVSDNSAADLDCFAEIHRTTNNSTYVHCARSGAGVPVANIYTTTTASALLDITDTSNQKVRFHASGLSTADCYGHGDYIHTYAIFIRLGDT